MGQTCNLEGKRRNVYRSLVMKHLGKYPLERLRRGWDDNIKMDFRETGCEDGR